MAISKAIADALLEEGKKIADLFPPSVSARSLSQVKEARLLEWEYEKHAPSTGYEDLDELVKGFVPGHLYVVTGETNIGKTSIACNFAVRTAFQKKRVLYIALEPENTVIDYLASVFWDKQFQELTEKDLDLADLPIDILGKEEIQTPKQLTTVIQSFSRYDLIIVDHIGYFIRSSSSSWVQEQANMMKVFAGFAKANKTAILLIAHLRKRAVQEKRHYTPTADDISGSGALKQDATDVFILTRDKMTDEVNEVRYAHTGKLYVVKTKSGQNGVIPIFFSERKAIIASKRDIETGKLPNPNVILLS